MADASIGVSQGLKRSLAAGKPEGMRWDDFLSILLQAADTNRFLSVAESMQVRSEQEAVERASARYTKHRARPESLLTGTELRRRVHLRRLLESLDAFRGSLQLSTENPNNPDHQAIRESLEELDAQIHDARDALQAA